MIQLASAAVGAAVIVERIKKILKERRAISEEIAKTPKELNLDERCVKMSANTIIPSCVASTKD